MFKDYASVEVLARNAIRVEHFATTALLLARPDDPAGEVMAWMTANDFDIAPVGSRHCVGFVKREELDNFDRKAPLLHAVRPLKEAVILPSSTSLEKAIHHLASCGWFFLGEGEQITGIATRHDLGKPAVSLYLFAKTMAFEAGLRRLAGSYDNKPIPDAPPDEDDDSSGSRYLSEVISYAKKVNGLIGDLGYEGKRGKFDEVTSFVVRLRNHIAHGRSILAISEKKASHFTRIEELDSLLNQIRRLAEERDQVWDAYGATQIVHRTMTEEVWAGHSAMTLSVPAPIVVLTASNAHEEVLSEGQNKARNRELLNLLRQRGFEPISVEGRSPCDRWKEESFAIQGMSREEAKDICKLFQQRAFFEISDNELVVVDADGNERARRSRCQPGRLGVG
jgi:hypothetical protein